MHYFHGSTYHFILPFSLGSCLVFKLWFIHINNSIQEYCNIICIQPILYQRFYLKICKNIFSSFDLIYFKNKYLFFLFSSKYFKIKKKYFLNNSYQIVCYKLHLLNVFFILLSLPKVWSLNHCNHLQQPMKIRVTLTDKGGKADQLTPFWPATLLARQKWVHMLMMG